MVRLTDRPDMTLDVYRGRKTTMQHVIIWEVGGGGGVRGMGVGRGAPRLVSGQLKVWPPLQYSKPWSPQYSKPSNAYDSITWYRDRLFLKDQDLIRVYSVC